MCIACLATKGRRAGLEIHLTAPLDARQFRRRAHSYCVSHTRYIIFIIRARDTRSRAGLYDAPRCRLIAFKALREPRRWGRLLSCLLVALQSNQNTTRAREWPNVMRNAPRAPAGICPRRQIGTLLHRSKAQRRMRRGANEITNITSEFFFLLAPATYTRSRALS